MDDEYDDDNGIRGEAPKRFLLADGDPPPVAVANQSGASPFLLIGDHAGRAIPSALGNLGLPAEAMDRHIAWDIGVAGLGEQLSRRLDATFVRQTYSRLVVDCNRRPSAPDAMPEVSDGQRIPGNEGLTHKDRMKRRRDIFAPYHARITGLLAARDQVARDTILVALHSFTPVFQGHRRPWRYGVLHRNDSAVSDRVLALLRAAVGDEAGDNQPYAMNGIDYTIPEHADAHRLPYIELEVRQDLIADAEGQAREAAFLAGILTRAERP